MANKQIKDLILISAAADDINLPCDNATQTYRVTGAQLKAYIQAAIAPLTTLGDILYAFTSGAPTRLAGNTTAVKKVLTQTGTGSASAAPAWNTPTPANLQVVAKTDAYTLVPDTDDLITGDASGGAFSLTLPDASGNGGKVFRIKKIDSSANAVTIARAGSDTIDGATTYALTVQYEAVEIVSDGTNWFIF